MFDLVIHDASAVVTVAGEGPSAEQILAPIANGAVAVADGAIAWVGPFEHLPKAQIGPDTKLVRARGGIVTPGFVDAHTHIVFAGDRAAEFELRARGASYLEIAKAGGGIANTVKATRAGDEDALVKLSRPRLRRLLEHGVTTAETKSGYGLSLEHELKLLRVIRRLDAEGPVSLLPTLLCAHSIPEEFRQDRRGYLKLCEEEILPRAAGEKLARFFDVFCEESAFTKDETTRLCEAATRHGLALRLHVDQLTASGGAALAAQLGALSADHLEQTDAAGIAALARAGTSAVLVPTATFFLKLRKYAPGRALWDGGVNVALGSNLNPGSAMSENFALTLSLAVLENGLTASEAFVAATRGSARSLGLSDRGVLLPGSRADLLILGCRDVQHLPWHLGISHVRRVFKEGRLVHQSNDADGPICD